MSVYLIGARQGGPVKIGFSGSPTGRLTALQTGSPFELVVLAQFSGGETEEKQLHELFAAERLRGEWFKRSARVRKFMDMTACKVAPHIAIVRLQHAREIAAAERRRARENAAVERDPLVHVIRAVVAGGARISGVALKENVATIITDQGPVTCLMREAQP